MPEWKPVPRHWQNDDDSKDAGAAMGLVVGPLLVLAAVLMVAYGLFKTFA